MLAVQRTRKRIESGKNTNKRLEKDTVTKPPGSEHHNRRHTQELRLRKRNLSAINSVDQAIYLQSLDLGMKYDLVFGYFGWIGIDLDICFDVLRFSVMVCRFQILILFVLLWICLFNLGKG